MKGKNMSRSNLKSITTVVFGITVLILLNASNALAMGSAPKDDTNDNSQITKEKVNACLYEKKPTGKIYKMNSSILNPPNDHIRPNSYNEYNAEDAKNALSRELKSALHLCQMQNPGGECLAEDIKIWDNSTSYTVQNRICLIDRSLGCGIYIPMLSTTETRTRFNFSFIITAIESTPLFNNPIYGTALKEKICSRLMECAILQLDTDLANFQKSTCNSNEIPQSISANASVVNKRTSKNNDQQSNEQKDSYYFGNTDAQ